MIAVVFILYFYLRVFNGIPAYPSRTGGRVKIINNQFIKSKKNECHRCGMMMRLKNNNSKKQNILLNTYSIFYSVKSRQQGRESSIPTSGTGFLIPQFALIFLIRFEESRQ